MGVWQVGRAIWDSDVFGTISKTDWAALTTCLFDFGKEALQQTLLLGWNRRRGYHIPSVHQFSLEWGTLPFSLVFHPGLLNRLGRPVV